MVVLPTERGPETLGEDGRLNVGAVKLMADGALGSRGAALHDSYCDDPGNTGLVLVPGDEIEGVTLEAGSARLPGVRARHRRSRQSPGAGRLRARARPRAPRRTIACAWSTRRSSADDDIPRFRRLGVLPSMQATPLHSGHGVGGRAPGPRPAARGLRLALAAGDRRRSSPAARTSRWRPPTRSTGSTPRDAPAPRAATIRAGSPSSG